MTDHACEYGPDGHCVVCYERVDATDDAVVRTRDGDVEIITSDTYLTITTKEAE